MRAWPVVVFALLAVPLSGCLESGVDEEEAPISLRVTPSSARVDGTVTYTLTLTVREPVTIEHPGCPPQLLDAHLTLRSGGQVPLYTYGEDQPVGACAVREITLEPDTYTRDVSWNGRVEPAAPDPHEGPFVQQGTYTVTGRLLALDRSVNATASVIVPP